MNSYRNSQNFSGKPRKSPWRFLFAAFAVYGTVKWLERLWFVLLGFFVRESTTIHTSEVLSVGIIGGADGPTSILIAGPVWGTLVIPTVFLVVGLLGWIWLAKKCSSKKDNKE